MPAARIPVEAGDLLIVGLGVSGRAVANYCLDHAEELRLRSLTLVDGSAGLCVDDLGAGDAAERNGVIPRIVRGASAVPDGRYDLCVVTPGLPPHTPLFKSAAAASCEVITEPELAFRLSDSAVLWVGVTGTNGKTTVVDLTTHLLSGAGRSAYAVGNIGVPVIEVVSEAKAGDILVVELSSFQLAHMPLFAPDIAVLLNITPDHLDWHGSFDEYARAKERILLRAKLKLRDLSPDAGDLPLESLDALPLKGEHNLLNALYATAIARALGLRDEEIAAGLRSYRPQAHRLQEVVTVDGVTYVNDSKATNEDATIQALTAYPPEKTILLLGGRNKGSSYSELAKAVKKVRHIILFGEARDELATALSRTLREDGGSSVGLSHAGTSGKVGRTYMGTPTEYPHPLVTTSTMAEAVEKASLTAQPGDIVLLSPGCASFDEFDNYEERGKAFVALVRDFAGAS